MAQDGTVEMGGAAKLMQRVLEDSDNDLPSVTRAFLEGRDGCWHVDRHVLEPFATAPNAGLVRAACAAAVALGRKWVQERAALQGGGVLLSEPFVIIDDEWLARTANAAPPHVYLCLGRDETTFRPVDHADAVEMSSGAEPTLQTLLRNGEWLRRLAPDADGERGAWLVGDLRPA